MNRPYPKSFFPLTFLTIILGGSLLLIGCNNDTPTDQSASPTRGQPEIPLDSKGDVNPLTVGMTDSDRPSTDPLELFKNEQIKEELNLSEEQVTQISEINREFRQELGKIAAGLDLSNLDPQAQQEKLNEIRPQIEEEIDQTRAKVAEVLTPEQLSRYKGIILQIYGWGVLISDEFVEELQLTEEQQAQLSELREQMVTEMRGNWEPPTSNDPAERERTIDQNRRRMERIIEQTNNESLAVLTPEQKKSLEDLKGEKFQFKASHPPGS